MGRHSVTSALWKTAQRIRSAHGIDCAVCCDGGRIVDENGRAA
jgi:hypothetical protein